MFLDGNRELTASFTEKNNEIACSIKRVSSVSKKRMEAYKFIL